MCKCLNVMCNAVKLANKLINNPKISPLNAKQVAESGAFATQHLSNGRGS